ncbi:kinase [Patescibacteria group bacterium]
MIISKTPFRISFFGGGTDYPVWYREHGGAVLSTTIDKYCYINCRYLPPFLNYKYLIRYSLREETQDVFQIKHPSVRECLKFLNIKEGIEMAYTADLPGRSGIGSSASFTTGFLNCLYSLIGKTVSKRQLALDAIHVDRDLIGENVGSQDQTAAAFGGLNKIIFGGEKEIDVQPIIIDQKKMDLLQDHFMFFFTGISRDASNIAAEQIKQTPSKTQELQTMYQMVDESINILNGPIERINDFGKLLNESWKLKRSLTNLITTSEIDDIYEVALGSGALGGKLCGAGGGGFIVLFVPPEAQSKVKERLRRLLQVPFRFDFSGSQIIFNDTQKLNNKN